MKKYQAFVRLIRWRNLMVIIVTQYIARICLAGDKTQFLSYIIDPRLFLLVLSSTLLAAAGYIINDYYDIKIDMINKPERLIIGKYISRRYAIFIHQFFNALSISIGLYLSVKVAVMHFIIAFFLWLYSNALKRKPLIGNILVAALTASTLLIVGVYFNNKNILVYGFTLFAFFIALIREILKDMSDIKGDMTFGSKTLPILYGIRKTKTIIYVVLFALISTSLVFCIWVQNNVLSLFFVLLLFPISYFVNQLYWADTRTAYRRLNRQCKWLMVSGVVLMLLV
jgi:4-hydroxybenzoate polyprenyltransferase